MFRRRPHRLSARFNELSELVQRERIESANRFAAIEGRLAALGDELSELSETRDRHRDDLTQIGHALAVHQRALDQTVAGLGGVYNKTQPDAPKSGAEIALPRSEAASR
jgi:hypothetical protein